MLFIAAARITASLSGNSSSGGESPVPNGSKLPPNGSPGGESSVTGVVRIGIGLLSALGHDLGVDHAIGISSREGVPDPCARNTS